MASSGLLVRSTLQATGALQMEEGQGPTRLEWASQEWAGLASWRGAETSMLCLFQELLYLAGAQEAEEGLRLVGHPHL